MIAEFSIWKNNPSTFPQSPKHNFKVRVCCNTLSYSKLCLWTLHCGILVKKGNKDQVQIPKIQLDQMKETNWLTANYNLIQIMLKQKLSIAYLNSIKFCMELLHKNIGVHKKCIFYTRSCMKIECAKLIKTFFNNNYFISLSSITTMFLALVCLFFVPTLSVFFLSPLKFLLKEKTHDYFPLPLCDYFL